MNESVSVASLMSISERARALQGASGETESHLVSQKVLKPLLKTLGWQSGDDTGTRGDAWGKAYFTYDARRDVYAGCIGGQYQIIAAGQAGSDTSVYIRLIEYAYNKDAAWALSVSPEVLKLFHTHESALKNDKHLSPYWELTVDLLPTHQDEVARMLSASAALKGTLGVLDRDVRDMRRVALPVNRKLFESLRYWRGQLIEQVYKNAVPNGSDLDAIDRDVNHLTNQLVFIRVAEDRGFGESPSLREAYDKWSQSGRESGVLLSHLRSLRQEYAVRYRVDLFSNGTLLDAEYLETSIGQMIDSLHTPGFPTVKYDFSVIDVDVLGSMYEQYLRLQPQLAPPQASRSPRLIGEPAQTELVPSDRALGVKYTPSYIVEYIVGSALRRWYAQPTNTHRPRVFDMACGSGSFLLAAYRRLLQEEESKIGHPLSRQERQQLLTSCVWGADKDPKAVEICKLNLWLFALEARQSLPSLDHNIWVGDSLLDRDVGIMGKRAVVLPAPPGGIDCQSHPAKEDQGWDVIVGNPPYIRIQKLEASDKAAYLRRFKYLKGNYDISLAFVERSLELLKPFGIAGFIIANSFIRANYASLLREEVVKRGALLGILDFGDQRVFEGVGAYTCILFLGRSGGKSARMGVILRLSPCPAAQLALWENAENYDDALVSGAIDLSRLSAAPWVLVPDQEHALREKLRGVGVPLDNLAHIFQGLKTGLDAAFILRRLTVPDEEGALEVLGLDGRKVTLERAICIPLVKGGDIERFHVRPFSHWILFPYRDGILLSAQEMEREFPQAWAYLLSIRRQLTRRPEVQRRHAKWYGYSFPKSMMRYSERKLLTPDMASQASFFYDEQGLYAFTGGAAGGYGISLKSDQVSYEFLLGLLNSRLIDWYIQAVAAQFHGGYFSYERRFIGHTPIRIADSLFKEQAENITSIVRLLQSTYLDSLSGERQKTEREYRETSILLSKLEQELNSAVMDLYELNSDERRLVLQSPYWRKAKLLSGN